MPRRFARLLFVLIIAAAPEAAFAQTSAAQTSGDSPSRLFARLDRDRNGAVTAQEFMLTRNLDFQRLDRNNDRYLGRAEFIDNRSPKSAISARAQRLRALRIRRYAEIDSDRDGRIAQREYMAFGRRLFARLDRNGDGKLISSEVTGRRTGAVKSSQNQQAGALFRQLDNNRDGAISLGELLSARRIVFRRLDTDKNGTISVAEFAAREASIVAASGRALPPRSALPVRASRRFRQLDGDNNAQLSVGEYLAVGRISFAAADSDRNGRLSRAEFARGAGR